MLKPYINTRMLKRAKACSDEIRLFKETFPLLASIGVPFTLANARKASNAGLDISFVSGVLFRPLTGGQCEYGLASCSEHRPPDGDGHFTPELFMKVYRNAKKAQK